MKKTILLGSIFTASLLFGYEVDPQLAAEIAAAKAEKTAAENKLKALETKLPQNQDIMTYAKFGYIKTDGNTNTEVASIDGTVKKAWGKNSVKFIFDAQYGKTESIVNKKKYLTELQYAYLFTETLSFAYIVGYKDDSFSSYDYQVYTGPGAKWKAHSSNRQKLNLEGSILFSQDKFIDVTPLEDEKNTYSSCLIKLAYELKIIENLTFNQNISYRSAIEDYNVPTKNTQIKIFLYS